MTTMRALLLNDGGLSLHSDYPRPVPQVGEALIRVTCAGVCATDLALIDGYKGGFSGVLGHEFVGIVEEAPDDPTWIGRRVVGEINIGCGECSLCRRGLGKHCRRRQAVGILRRNGAFADYLTLPLANLHAVPDGLPDQVAVFTEPLAAALQIVEQVRPSPALTVYQFGAGRLGLLTAQVLARTGCDLTVFTRNASKDHVLQQVRVARSVRIGSTACEELLGKPADVVIDATGAPDGFRRALEFVRPGGTIVLKSTYAEFLDGFDLSRLVVDEITLVGSRCGPFRPALRLLADGVIHTDPMITAVFPLDEAPDALCHAAGPGVLKVLIAMDNNGKRRVQGASATAVDQSADQSADPIVEQTNG